MRNTVIRAFVHMAGTAVRRVRRRWRTAAPGQRRLWRLTAGSAVVGVVIAGTAVTAAGPWDSGQRTAERALATARDAGSGENHAPDGPGAAPAPSAPPVLAALGPGGGRTAGRSTGGDVPPPSRSGLDDALAPLLKDPALGRVRTAAVVDAATGRRLFGTSASRAVTPASTVKLATAAAALAARGPDHRIATRVVRDGEGGRRLVLVGGGDPTLREKDLDALAKATARAVRKGRDGKGGDEKKDAPGKFAADYDTSLYSGPERHPIGSNPNLAPVSALMVRAARLDDSAHGPAPRATDPAEDAARHFAKALERHGLDVGGDPERARAAKGAEEVAVHRSAPLAALVESMLTHSDNDLAEALARQAALADARSAGFADAARAVRQRLAGLDLPLEGSHFADGSGLSRRNKMSAGLLTRLLADASGPRHPELRPLVTGLPVAGFTGTLGGRYGQSGGGAGLVRAKTGTLTGVNTLAGTVVDADGRLLLFAFMTTGAGDRYGAQAALDRMASALAGCGCR